MNQPRLRPIERIGALHRCVECGGLVKHETTTYCWNCWNKGKDWTPKKKYKADIWKEEHEKTLD